MLYIYQIFSKSYFFDIAIKVSILLYIISSLVLFSSKKTYSPFIIHWIATFFLCYHITFTVSLTSKLISYWRIILLLIYGIITSSYISRQFYLGIDLHFSSRIAIGVIGIIISLFTYFIILLLPTPSATKLYGKFQYIGTSSFNITKSDDHSEMTVQCWYPKAIDDTNYFDFLFLRKALLWTSGDPNYESIEISQLIEQLSKLNKIPLIAFQQLGIARTNSYFSKEIKLINFGTQKFPVVIYSHGLYGWRQIHHTACEQLASFGFIVFAVDHFPDATITRIYQSLESKPFEYHAPPHHDHTEEYRDYYNNGCDRRNQNIIDLIDYLQTNFELKHLNNQNLLNLNEFYLFGHSYGGATVACAACRDDRIAGVVLLDGWLTALRDKDRLNGSKAPILILSSELWPTSPVSFLIVENLFSISFKITKFSNILNIFIVFIYFFEFRSFY